MDLRARVNLLACLVTLAFSMLAFFTAFFRPVRILLIGDDDFGMCY